MNSYSAILVFLCFLNISSCAQNAEVEDKPFEYFEKSSTKEELLIAVTDEEYLQFGSRIAYLNTDGDTVIPFGKYAYLGTDTLRHFANVMVVSHTEDLTGSWIAIDADQNILFELVSFDNGPDLYNEELVRVRRNGKMGFANIYGQITIPCSYDFVWWFEGGQAKVTFKAKEVRDPFDEHRRVESDEWFYIDKAGKRVD